MATVTKKAKKPEAAPLSTGQVCDLLGLTDRRIQDVLRSMPRAQRPAVVNGKRAWAPADVEALRARLAELDGRAR